MEKTGRTILSIFFIGLIFIIGSGTVFCSSDSVREILQEEGFQAKKAAVEAAIQDKFLWKYGWINVNGLYQRTTGTTIVRSSDSKDSYDVYKLSNGQIMYNKKEKDVSKYAKKVIRLRDEVEGMGCHFMYAQLPFKIKDDSFMPPGTHTGGTKNGDQMAALLREADVDLINIKEEIEKADLDWSTLFFKTDHHWKPKTAMWAGSLIMGHLAEEYGYKVDQKHYDYDSYTKETYENYMLGAVGRRVGAWYDGLDDIDIVKPNFKTSMDFWGKSDDGIDERGGTFYDAVYLWDNLEKRSDFVRNSYSTYIGKEYAINVLTNNMNQDGPRILLIRESFSCALEPFIGLDASQIIAVDLRRYKKSIKSLCEKYEPDVVLLAYNPSAFNDKQFRFFRK